MKTVASSWKYRFTNVMALPSFPISELPATSAITPIEMQYKYVSNTYPDFHSFVPAMSPDHQCSHGSFAHMPHDAYLLMPHSPHQRNLGSVALRWTVLANVAFSTLLLRSSQHDRAICGIRTDNQPRSHGCNVNRADHGGFRWGLLNLIPPVRSCSPTS